MKHQAQAFSCLCIVIMNTAMEIWISLSFVTLIETKNLKYFQKICQLLHHCVFITEKAFYMAIVLQTTVLCLVLQNVDNVVTGGYGH